LPTTEAALGSQQGGEIEVCCFSKRTMVRTLMSSRRFVVQSNSGETCYTNLFACISQEEDGYTVQIRLYNDGRPENNAWGEEMADSFETASMLLEAIAAEFWIAQPRIKIELRMQDTATGTRH